ncbi:hypothetical protein F5882DRAFT_395156 [Hyaloscypha sp. PMI_1271]|nr:hypothetical protein F5882DRAFT_395156 [Hyaloscypha sp. PMI_1271]
MRAFHVRIQMAFAISFFLLGQIRRLFIVMRQRTKSSKPSHSYSCFFSYFSGDSGILRSKGDHCCSCVPRSKPLNSEISREATLYSAVHIAFHHPSSRIQDAKAGFSLASPGNSVQ